MNESPLLHILNWYQGIESEIQHELVLLSSSFAPNKELGNFFDGEQQIQMMFNYLSIQGLTPDEVVAKSIIAIGLFDLSFVGRDSEHGWDTSMDRNLDMRSKLVDENRSPEIVDNALKDWQHRKYTWIQIASTWEELKTNHLTPSLLMEWHRNATLERL